MEECLDQGFFSQQAGGTDQEHEGHDGQQEP